MDTPAGPEQLGPVLRQTEAELARHLHDACEVDSREISEETTGELMRLEDSLLAAAHATERAIALRRQLKPPQAGAPDAGAPDAGAEAPADDATTSGVREFSDASGRRWRAWAVTPGRVRKVRDPQRYFGDYREGWLAFEALDTGARKRLPHHPANWGQLEDDALRRLLDSASDVTRRRDDER